MNRKKSQCSGNGSVSNIGSQSRQERSHRMVQPMVAALLLCLALSFAMCAPVEAQKVNEKQLKQNLSATYRDWLDRDVVYIITREERRAFLQLTSDDAREKFIARFWDIRNPTPGSPTNSYKDEIYERIAYANSNFGTGSGTDGWRTARGQTYITLGPPQQKQKYRVSANLVPIEIWFYSNPEYHFLPAFFSVLFYQKENFGDYRFYSPYGDGPDQLVNGTEAINDRKTALKLINDSLGPEVARLTLSLLPGEPVDETNGTATMESDSMLQMIKALGEQPVYREMMAQRSKMLDSVTSRLIVEGHNLDIVTLPIRDSHGLTRLDYAIRLHSASDLTVSQEADGHNKYSVEVRVRVFDANSKLLFTQQRSVSDSLDKTHFNQMRDKVFGFESSLPLPPGKYRLDFLLTDWMKKVGMHAERSVTIPTAEANNFLLPGVLAFSTAEMVDPAKVDLTPFAMAGLKFSPLPGNPLILTSAHDLQVAYQIWTAPGDPHAYQGRHLEVEYAIGQPSEAGRARTVKDEVEMQQFNVTGSMVNGKKIPLLGDALGNYILTVGLGENGKPQRGYATINFKVFVDSPAVTAFDVIDPNIVIDADNGILDQQRGLCYFAQGLSDESRPWFRRALDRNRANDPSRTRLVDAYFSKRDYPAVANLFNDTGVTEETDSETIIRIAASLEKTGDLKRAASLLENTIHSRTDEGALYLALADCYEQMGNASKAAELTKKGMSFLNAPPPNQQ